jgi:hypothetical protein
MAKICSENENGFRWAYGKKGTKMTTPNDYMPKWERAEEKEVKKQSVEEMKQAIMQIARRKNPEIKSRKDLNKSTNTKK